MLRECVDRLICKCNIEHVAVWTVCGTLCMLHVSEKVSQSSVIS